ncbi:hypothetical protein FBALC1_01392 [Flavobacteriales bacterium ALC-1]|nr:hypothetical protein FBALC1_01392 [Flavobacteriales bacterium ALC-1]
MPFKKFTILPFLCVALLFVACSKDSDSESCPQVSSIDFSLNGSSAIYLYFQTIQEANSYEIEYGISGFNLGTGMTFITSNSSLLVENLLPSTTYDFYITSICSSEDRSNPKGLIGITTEPSQCQESPTLSSSQDWIDRFRLNYSFSNIDPESIEIEYGLEGFNIGSGTILEQDVFGSGGSFLIQNIESGVTYDIYARAKCSETDIGEYAIIQHTTLPYCAKPFNLDVDFLGGGCQVNDPGIFRFEWSYYSGANASSFTISITQIGGSPSIGNQFSSSNDSITISGGSTICNGRDYYVRANCDDGSYSEWAGPYTF